MHIYQGERDLQDENRALAIPGGVQVNKEIAMSSGQFSQVKNSLNTRIYYHLSPICRYNVMRQRFSSHLFWKNGLALTSKFQ